MNLTKKQSEAIEQLEKAFARCSRLGLRFCGMDDNLFYATKKATAIGYDEADSHGGCSGVARAYRSNTVGTGIVDTKRSYLDSGGW